MDKESILLKLGLNSVVCQQKMDEQKKVNKRRMREKRLITKPKRYDSEEENTITKSDRHKIRKNHERALRKQFNIKSSFVIVHEIDDTKSFEETDQETAKCIICKIMLNKLTDVEKELYKDFKIEMTSPMDDSSDQENDLEDDADDEDYDFHYANMDLNNKRRRSDHVKPGVTKKGIGKYRTDQPTKKLATSPIEPICSLPQGRRRSRCSPISTFMEAAKQYLLGESTDDDEDDLKLAVRDKEEGGKIHRPTITVRPLSKLHTVPVNEVVGPAKSAALPIPTASAGSAMSLNTVSLPLTLNLPNEITPVPQTIPVVSPLVLENNTLTMNAENVPTQFMTTIVSPPTSQPVVIPVLENKQSSSSSELGIDQMGYFVLSTQPTESNLPQLTYYQVVSETINPHQSFHVPNILNHQTSLSTTSSPPHFVNNSSYLVPSQNDSEKSDKEPFNPCKSSQIKIRVEESPSYSIKNNISTNNENSTFSSSQNAPTSTPLVSFTRESASLTKEACPETEPLSKKELKRVKVRKRLAIEKELARHRLTKKSPSLANKWKIPAILRRSHPPNIDDDNNDSECEVIFESPGLKPNTVNQNNLIDREVALEVTRVQSGKAAVNKCESNCGSNLNKTKGVHQGAKKRTTQRIKSTETTTGRKQRLFNLDEYIFETGEYKGRNSQPIGKTAQFFGDPTKTFKCITCSKEFISHTAYVKHCSEHKKTTNVNCSVCGKFFSSKNDLLLHACKATTTSKQTLGHINSSMQILTCACGKKFTYQSSFRAHSEICSKLCKDSEKYLKCGCGKLFMSKDFLYAHQNGCSIENFKCVECGKAFVTKKELDTHALSHLQKNVFGCDGCPKFFLTEAYLEKHKSTLCPGRNKITPDFTDLSCKVCGAVFLQEDDIAQHPCQPPEDSPHVAFAELSQNTLRQAALKKKQQNQPKLVIASLLSGSDIHEKSPKIITPNVRRIKESEQPRFRCSLCDAMFKSVDDLKFHQSIHTPPR